MYRCLLRILLCSSEPCVERVARAAECRERFEHRVEVCASLGEADLSQADILVADLTEVGVQAIRARMKPGALLLLCAGRGRLDALEDAELASADDWWLYPLNERLCALRLGRILDELKSRKENWLVRNYLDTAMDSVPDMIWFKDIEGRHLKVNDAFSHVVNKPKSDIFGKSHYYIWDIPVEEYQKGEYVCVETEDEVIQARKTCLFMEMVKTRNGMRQFRTHKTPIFDEAGENVIGTVGVAHDVTDLANVGTELEILIQSIPFAVVIRDTSGIIVNINERIQRYFGVTKEAVLGQDFGTWERAMLQDSGVLNSEGRREAVVHAAPGVEERTLEIQEETICDVFRNNVGTLCLYRDVTRERVLESKVLYNMNTDFLTKLYNRRYFYQHITENRSAGGVSLLYVDLDNFKQINDTYGHAAGDEALVRTADILRSCFPGELIARLGGDEFIVALLGTHSPEELQRRARDLLDRMRQIFGASKRFHALSASVGIAQTGDSRMDIDLLIQRSDTALYDAKQCGKNQYRTYQQP